jgi:hypothetical protein
VVGLSGVASAAPTVTLKVKPVPLKGFPGTGDILGAGAAVEVQYTIKGSEVPVGAPSQLRKVVFDSPAGVKLNPKPFVTCSVATLEAQGPEGCPKKSQASPVGSAGVVDYIGGEPVREKATLQAFFSPNGILSFYANGVSPISAQVLVPGRFENASAPFGPKFVGEVPLVDSVPGAPPVSTESITVKVGAAVKKHKKVHSYITLPKKCPKGGFPVKSELTFEAVAPSTTMETVAVTYTVPCPKK